MSPDPSQPDNDPEPHREASAAGLTSSQHDANPPRRPTWVIVTGVLFAVLVVIVIVMLLAGGNHGPGRHASGEGGLSGPYSMGPVR